MQKNERQQITWCHAQNEVSLRVLYKFVNLISTLVICLKFVFIEMLDKHITYISVLIQDFVSGLACCVNIPHHNSLNLLSWLVVILVHTTDSIWYKVLYHHIMYVMGMYHYTINDFSFRWTLWYRNEKSSIVLLNDTF